MVRSADCSRLACCVCVRAGLIPPGTKCSPVKDSWCKEGAVVAAPVPTRPMLVVTQGEILKGKGGIAWNAG